MNSEYGNVHAAALRTIGDKWWLPTAQEQKNGVKVYKMNKKSVNLSGKIVRAAIAQVARFLEGDEWDDEIAGSASENALACHMVRRTCFGVFLRIFCRC
jgi:hypothetical protein